MLVLLLPHYHHPYIAPRRRTQAVSCSWFGLSTQAAGQQDSRTVRYQNSSLLPLGPVALLGMHCNWPASLDQGLQREAPSTHQKQTQMEEYGHTYQRRKQCATTQTHMIACSSTTVPKT